MCETNNGLVRNFKLFTLKYPCTICKCNLNCSLSTSVGALYVHKYFNEESKKGAASLVKSIHEEFLETLKNVPWMDETSRVAAIEKAHKMNYHIAYPDELVDNSKLEEYYHGLELETDSLLQNVLRIRKFNSDHAISKLRLPVNKTDWETHSFPTVVNAFYSLLENSIRKTIRFV